MITLDNNYNSNRNIKMPHFDNRFLIYQNATLLYLSIFIHHKYHS